MIYPLVVLIRHSHICTFTKLLWIQIVSLEKCTGQHSGVPTEEVCRLSPHKSANNHINPSLTFYWCEYYWWCCYWWRRWCCCNFLLQGIYRTAAQLKAIRPDLKVMFYWSAELVHLASVHFFNFWHLIFLWPCCPWLSHKEPLKILIVISFLQAGLKCYANYKTFMAHPEWFLKDDNGNVLNAHGVPYLDFTNEVLSTLF